MIKTDLMNTLGIEPEKTLDPLPAAGIFGAGLLLGAGLGLLFAPKKGSELRGQIGEGISDGKESVQETLGEAKAKAVHGLERIRSNSPQGAAV